MLPEWLTPQAILLAIAFVFVLFVLYKFFKLLTRLALAAVAGFAFPWIVSAVADYLGIALPFALQADVATGLKFAAAGVGLMLLAEVVHAIKAAIKIITWSFRRRKL